ncbi:MAG: glycerol-3-phosphate 1-O-acyltransferase PlsY [Sphingopyxis sp.]
MQILWQTPAMMLLMGYVLGSIPFGLLLTRMAGAGDIRAIGSGNIGATNVLRTGRKGLAAATLLLDLAKGAGAVCLARVLSPDDAVIAGAAAVIGHLYPIWLRFRGGKGVATLMGVATALDWRIGALYAALWIGVLALARISSLGGIVAALSVPITAALLGRSDLVPIGAGLALLVLWRHRDNIGRLLRGTEPRIGGASNTPTDAS